MKGQAMSMRRRVAAMAHHLGAGRGGVEVVREDEGMWYGWTLSCGGGDGECRPMMPGFWVDGR